MDNNQLSTISDAVTDLGGLAVKLFVHNPNSQTIAATALITEQMLFALIMKLHAPKQDKPAQ